MVRPVVVALAAGLLLAGCWGDDPPPATTSVSVEAAAVTNPSPAAASGTAGTTTTTAATSSTSPRLGAPQRPIPPQTPFELSSEWSFTVRSARDDGQRLPTTTIRPGPTTTDPFGTVAPPPPVIVRIGVSVAYNGVFAQGYLTALRVGVVGSTAVPYRSAPCPSLVTDALDLASPVAKGQTVSGTLCFVVEQADTTALRLYARVGPSTRDNYFTLPSA
ncbi:MAG: hypothetical protein ACKO91_14935 [Acidimicrobiales bacterium]